LGRLAGCFLFHVFLLDRHAAFELDHDAFVPDLDPVHQHFHRGAVGRCNGTVTSGLISLFFADFGSSPYAPTLFTFLSSAKKRKKYTSVFDRFRARKTKNRAPEKSIDRSEALFCLIFLVLLLKTQKERLLLW